MLNLAVKLYLTNPQQTELLCQYLFNLSRYDENYDVRDRARFLKPFIFPSNGQTILSKNAKKIFLAQKPAPLLESKYKGREQFQLGSLSHYLNTRTTGYHDLPAFPKKAPDSSVRGVENANEVNAENENSELSEWARKKTSNKSNKKDKSFYSDSENESSEEGTNDSDSDSSEESSTEDDSKSNSGSGSETGENDSDKTDSNESSSDENSSNSESDSSDEDTSGSTSVEAKPKNNKNSSVKPKETIKSKVQQQPASKSEKSNLDLLLDLGDIAPSGPVMTPSMGGFLTPMSNSFLQSTALTTNSRYELIGPNFISLDKHELLNKINGHGLQINYRFTRAPHLYSAKMVSLELTFQNDSHNDLENIHLSDKSTLPSGVSLYDFASIAKLNPGQSMQSMLGIDFNDSTQSIAFEIASNAGKSKVSLKSTIGEVIRAIRITETIFKEEQSRLRGMNEHTATFDCQCDVTTIQKRILDVANLGIIANNKIDDKDIILFAGQTMSSQILVLALIERNNSNGIISITVNCEKMVIGSILLNEIKNSIINS